VKPRIFDHEEHSHVPSLLVGVIHMLESYALEILPEQASPPGVERGTCPQQNGGGVSVMIQLGEQSSDDQYIMPGEAN
jgi:hypothetical protein